MVSGLALGVVVRCGGWLLFEAFSLIFIRRLDHFTGASVPSENNLHFDGQRDVDWSSCTYAEFELKWLIFSRNATDPFCNVVIAG